MNIEYMRNYIKERGIKITSLADPLGYVPQTVYNIFEGRKGISMEDSFKLKLYMRMTEAEFEKGFSNEDWFELYRRNNRG